MRGQFVGVLTLAAQQILQLAQAAMHAEFAQAVASFEQLIAHVLRELLPQIGQVAVKLEARTHDEFGGGGRSGGAQVGREIGNGEVGLMPDAGNDGNRTRSNGPRDDLFVEGPEVAEGSHRRATEDEDIDELFAIEIFDGGDDFAGRFLALHAHGIDDEVQIRKAAAQDAHYVAHGRAARRGDQADALREHGQRLFARGVEQSFGFEALLQLVEGKLERAESHRLDVLDVNLVFAASLVNADRAADRHVQAVLGTKLQADELLAKADAANLRASVLQREVEMAGLRRMGVRDFSLDLRECR